MKLKDPLAIPAQLDRYVGHCQGGVMNRSVLSIFALWGLVACSGGSFEGRLVDPLNNDAPLAGRMIVAKALSQVRMTCQQLSGTTDDQGHFTIDGLCLKETGYRLSDPDGVLFLADVDEIPKGGAESLMVIRAWPAPAGSGVYKLSGGALNPIPTHADIKEEQIYRSTETVSYPKSVPEPIPDIGAGDYLVITGKENLDKMALHPLVRSDSRRFGTKDQWVEMAPWWYIGTRFTSDTEFERGDTELMQGHVLDMEKGDRAARFIPGDALPAGLYALTREGGRRAYVLQFGPPPAAPKVASGEE